jgi:hypothetical protein
MIGQLEFDWIVGSGSTFYDVSAGTVKVCRKPYVFRVPFLGIQRWCFLHCSVFGHTQFGVRSYYELAQIMDPATHNTEAEKLRLLRHRNKSSFIIAKRSYLHRLSHLLCSIYQHAFCADKKPSFLPWRKGSVESRQKRREIYQSEQSRLAH